MSSEELLRLYRKLWLARQAEEKIRAEYSKNEIKTPVHLGNGGEAIPVGVCHCLPPGSKTFGTYRNHALYLAVTGDTDGFFKELYGKGGGVAKGKAGSMHLSSPESGMLATSAVVGTTIPLAVGAALANDYMNVQAPVAVFFGDGAVEEGVFWESLNFSSLHRLRILFVCEDNDLAIHSGRAERRGFKSIEDIVKGFDCHFAGADGSDVTAVVDSTRDVLARMNDRPAPAFLHLSYFRLLEHVGIHEDFNAKYRRQPEAGEIERLDPVLRFERFILESGVKAGELAAIQDEIHQQIAGSVIAAQEAAFPAPSELYTDTFA